MKIFISYHRKDTAYRKKAENILRHYGIDYYAVPINKDFNGKAHQDIENFILQHMKDCDAVLCLIGTDTYSRPHVDREIHAALKGDISSRKGIIGVHLPCRTDDLSSLDLNTFPTKLRDNMNYVVWTRWIHLNENIKELIKAALDNAKNPKMKTNHKNPCMQLRTGKYYDN